MIVVPDSTTLRCLAAVSSASERSFEFKTAGMFLENVFEQRIQSNGGVKEGVAEFMHAHERAQAAPACR
jgi:hypothetical protein